MTKENADNINMDEITRAALEKCNDMTGNCLEKTIVKRFLTYVSFDTQSDPNTGTVPSTMKQKELGRYLVEEFRQIGLTDVLMDECGFVYATLPASEGKEENDPLGFLCHMDVADASPAADIHTIIEEINGRSVIRTDGKTLLGADDKAGLAEVVTAAQVMLADPQISHPQIRIVATIDEEIGEGISHIDHDRLNVPFAYTIDGEELGELTYETWNAASAKVTFTGVMTHAGSGYGKMKNAILMMNDFINMLPANETPATTKDRDGFYHVEDVTGLVDYAVLKMILRDFEKEGLEKKIGLVKEVCAAINEKYGAGSAQCEINYTYPNMKEYIVPKYGFLIDRAKEAYEACGVKPLETSARGGTDGSVLSSMGVPTPNLGTGGANAHGKDECIAVYDMEKMVEVIVELASRF